MEGSHPAAVDVSGRLGSPLLVASTWEISMKSGFHLDSGIPRDVVTLQTKGRSVAQERSFQKPSALSSPQFSLAPPFGSPVASNHLKRRMVIK